MRPVVLITGCSTGIGRAAAEHLTGNGYPVVATARDPQSLAGLSAPTKLALDVTDPASVDAAVSATLREHGRIDVLVNNAGYSVRGALEEIPDDALRQMFDVNVFGVLRMIRAVAPVMRAQGSGRIITIGSIAGKMSTPGHGAYSATKFAVEALSDALRLELAPFGVAVSLIEPGAIETRFDETAQRHSGAIVTNPASPYRALYAVNDRFSASLRTRRTGPDVVARVVQRAVEARSPRARYLAGVTLPGAVALHTRDYLWGPITRRIFAFKPSPAPNDGTGAPEHPCDHLHRQG